MARQCLHLAAVAAALLLCCSSAEAGCYRHNRTRPAISPDDYHYNDEPVPLLAAEHLPRRFDWSDVDGKNLLAPSWGQHQPRYCGSCFAHGTHIHGTRFLPIPQDREVASMRCMLADTSLFEGAAMLCCSGDSSL